MNKIFLGIAFNLLLFSANLLGQRPTPVPAKTKELPTVEATTKDGKKVTLKGDGTWVMASPEPAAATSSLYLNISLPSGFGDVKEAVFYLIDKPLSEIVSSPELIELYKTDARSHKETNDVLKDYVPSPNLLFLWMNLYPRLYPTFANEGSKQFAKHRSSSAHWYPSLGGPAIFNDVPRRRYFLVGYIANQKFYSFTFITTKVLMWNQEVNPDKQVIRLALDEKNVAEKIDTEK